MGAGASFVLGPRRSPPHGHGPSLMTTEDPAAPMRPRRTPHPQGMGVGGTTEALAHVRLVEWDIKAWGPAAWAQGPPSLWNH